MLRVVQLGASIGYPSLLHVTVGFSLFRMFAHWQQALLVNLLFFYLFIYLFFYLFTYLLTYLLTCSEDWHFFLAHL